MKLGERNTIFKKYRAIGEYSEKQKDLIEKIERTNSVAIHIRRTDYLDPQNEGYNVLSYIYYEKAIMYICSCIDNPYFYVFSDDIEFGKEMLQNYQNAIFVDRSYGNSDVQDFEMMRKCRHFIIANSTFSWWASQMSDNSSKIMISPRTWFLAEVHEQFLNAIMEDYILIDE